MNIDIEQLKAGLSDQRWFGDKGRRIATIEVLDHATVEGETPELVMTILLVTFADGGMQMYHAPLLVEEGSTRDAFEEVARLGVLGELMAGGTTLSGDHGTFHFGGPGLDPLSPPGGSSRAIGAEQSNTSLVIDDEIIIKLFRRVDVGPNPDLELNRLLTNEGFEYVPPQVGEIIYEGEIDSEEIGIDLAIAQRFVHGATDGWTEALGHVTAAMHVLLAREDIDPDFVPEPLDPSDVKEAVEGVRRSVTDLIAASVSELEELRVAIDERIDAA